MKSSVEALEGNKVKVTVEVEEAEFENDLNLAFKRLAKEVRLPGFRPGKAPRKVLEARIGSGYARQEAFREGLPNYYVEAVKEHEVDVIAPPDIEIVDGEESGPVTFDAVVEIRPAISIDGYQGLEVEVLSPIVPEEEIDEAIDRMRGQFGSLQSVDRPAEDGDRVKIDIEVTHDGEPVEGLTTDDYLYQVGMGAVVPELDDHLEGASAGDELSFSAAHPDEDEEGELFFEITVNEVQATALPDLDEDFVQENSEFDTVEELRADFRTRMGEARLQQAVAARRAAVGEALAALVDDDAVPEALVNLEVDNQAQDMTMRLQAQGLSLDQYMQFTGTSREDLLDQLREQAAVSARTDLALRSIAEAEGIEVDDEALDAEFAGVASQVGRPIEEIRRDFSAAGQLPALRSDLRKSKALDWVIERTRLVDADGNEIDPDLLVLPEDDPSDPAPESLEQHGEEE